MNNQTILAGLVAVVILAAVFYLSAGKDSDFPNNLIPEIDGDNESDTGAINQAERESIIDRVINNITKNGAPAGINIVKDSVGGGGSGGSGTGGGGSGAGCLGSAHITGTADYYIRARIDTVQIVPDPQSGQDIRYTYAMVDEYQKMNSTDPNIDPSNLLIISADDSDADDGEAQQEFTYAYITTEEWGYSTVC